MSGDGDRGPARPVAAWAVILLLSLSAAGSAPAIGGYADGPPPAHTGGFGEPTCVACHRGPRPGPEVRLAVEGLPARYAAGESYRLTVVLRAPELSRGGFQLSTRFLTGDCRGGRAGALRPGSDRVAVDDVEAGSGDRTSYARHTLPGSTPGAAERRGRLAWRLDWTSPPAEAPCAGRPVALDVAANASNHDASEFGDRIVARRLVVPGPRPETSAGATP